MLRSLTAKLQVVTVSQISWGHEDSACLGVVGVHMSQECAAFVLGFLEFVTHSWGAIPTPCQSASNGAIVEAGNAHIGGIDVEVLGIDLTPTSWRGGRGGQSQERDKEGAHRHSV